jgi:hypothetical protein
VGTGSLSTSRSGAGAAKGTCEVMGTQGNVRGQGERARLWEREPPREQVRPRERPRPVETGSEPRIEGVGRPYL